MFQRLTLSASKSTSTFGSKIPFILLFFGLLIAAPANSQTAPNDPRFNSQWFLEQGSEIGIDFIEVSDIAASKQKSEVVVAVIDSAMDISHPDLVDKIWKNPN